MKKNYLECEISCYQYYSEKLVQISPNEKDHIISFDVSGSEKSNLDVPLLTSESGRFSLSMDVGIKSISIPLYPSQGYKGYYTSLQITFIKEVADFLGLGSVFNTTTLANDGTTREINGLLKKGYQLNWDETCIIIIWGLDKKSNKLGLQNSEIPTDFKRFLKYCFSVTKRSKKAKVKGKYEVPERYEVVDYTRAGQKNSAVTSGCERGLKFINQEVSHKSNILEVIKTGISVVLGTIPYAGQMLSAAFLYYIGNEDRSVLIRGTVGINDIKIFNKETGKLINFSIRLLAAIIERHESLRAAKS
ncbi:hypothetical protein AYI68_g2707 [Smittium mucronatum]|uniref:Uncharacterized protein n=1 Tax=Smittium mucronatum TaxID=133383 RepID=A0A1R0H1Z1_9FUNG|nr:hypothetical protein AYI68_g2707 [Smittium mucronatum]